MSDFSAARHRAVLRATRAFTLIECLVVIVVTTLVLVTVSTTLHALNRVQARVRAEIATHSSLARFATELRLDCHRATTPPRVVIEQATASTLHLTLGEQHAVQYRCEPPRIVRTELLGTNPARREVFRIGDVSNVEWRVGLAERQVEWRYRPAPAPGGTGIAEDFAPRSIHAALPVVGEQP